MSLGFSFAMNGVFTDTRETTDSAVIRIKVMCLTNYK